MSSEDLKKKPRVIIIQILYAKNFNSEFEIKFPKHRFKKFIKDIVLGCLERKELIEETICPTFKLFFQPSLLYFCLTSPIMQYFFQFQMNLM